MFELPLAQNFEPSAQAVAMVRGMLGLLSTDPPPPDFQVGQAVTVLTNIAHAYTRGVGFDRLSGLPNDEITSVIALATARLLRNPSQLPVREQYGGIVVDFRGGFTGWTLGELQTLDRYRIKAQ